MSLDLLKLIRASLDTAQTFAQMKNLNDQIIINERKLDYANKLKDEEKNKALNLNNQIYQNRKNLSEVDSNIDKVIEEKNKHDITTAVAVEDIQSHMHSDDFKLIFEGETNRFNDDLTYLSGEAKNINEQNEFDDLRLKQSLKLLEYLNGGILSLDDNASHMANVGTKLGLRDLKDREDIIAYMEKLPHLFKQPVIQHDEEGNIIFGDDGMPLTKQVLTSGTDPKDFTKGAEFLTLWNDPDKGFAAPVGKQDARIGSIIWGSQTDDESAMNVLSEFSPNSQYFFGRVKGRTMWSDVRKEIQNINPNISKEELITLKGQHYASLIDQTQNLSFKDVSENFPETERNITNSMIQSYKDTGSIFNIEEGGKPIINPNTGKPLIEYQDDWNARGIAMLKEQTGGGQVYGFAPKHTKSAINKAIKVDNDYAQINTLFLDLKRNESILGENILETLTGDKLGIAGLKGTTKQYNDQKSISLIQPRIEKVIAHMLEYSDTAWLDNPDSGYKEWKDNPNSATLSAFVNKSRNRYMGEQTFYDENGEKQTKWTDMINGMPNLIDGRWSQAYKIDEVDLRFNVGFTDAHIGVSKEDDYLWTLFQIQGLMNNVNPFVGEFTPRTNDDNSGYRVDPYSSIPQFGQRQN